MPALTLNLMIGVGADNSPPRRRSSVLAMRALAMGGAKCRPRNRWPGSDRSARAFRHSRLGNVRVPPAHNCADSVPRPRRLGSACAAALLQGHNEPRDRLILGAGIRSPPEEDAGWPRRRPRSNHYKGRKVRRRRRAGRGDRREGDRHWGNDTTSLHTVHLRESDLRKRFGLRTKRIDSVRTIAVWSFEKRITYRPGPPFEDLAWRERGHARREAVRRQSRLVAARLNRMRHVVVFLCALQIATAVSRHKRKRFAQYEGAGDSTSILRYIERGHQTD